MATILAWPTLSIVLVNRESDLVRIDYPVHKLPLFIVVVRVVNNTITSADKNFDNKGWWNYPVILGGPVHVSQVGTKFICTELDGAAECNIVKDHSFYHKEINSQ